MDRSVLIQYADMKEEIKDLRRRITRLEEQIRRIEEEGTVSDVVKGGMGGTQHFTIKGFPDREYHRKKSLLMEHKARLERKEIELLELTGQVEEYINSIDSSELRLMSRYYYLDGLTWGQVAIMMNNHFPKRKIKYSEDSCRMKNTRFFEKNL